MKSDKCDICKVRIGRHVRDGLCPACREQAYGRKGLKKYIRK